MAESDYIEVPSFAKDRRFAWAQMPVYDKDRNFIGYAMRHFCGVTLSKLAHHAPAMYKKHFPGLDRIKIATMAVNLWESIDLLHKNNVYVGDINPDNVLCSKQYEICWIDTDSFQIGKSQTKPDFFPCMVGRAEFTPPEHLGEEYSEIVRTRESDIFSLAILTFKCFMSGQHPYQRAPSVELKDLCKENFPYAEGNRGRHRPDSVPHEIWWEMWCHLSDDIKNLFIKTFVDGQHQPERRPSAAQWQSGLKAYIRAMENGQCRREIRPMQVAAARQNPSRRQFNRY